MTVRVNAPWDYGGYSCAYDTTLVQAANGAITFTYDDGFLYLFDAGTPFPTGGQGTISIYDATNPLTGPTLISTTNTGLFTGPYNGRVYGNLLFLPCRRPDSAARATALGQPGVTPSLQIWDITDKAAPVKLGTYFINYTLANGLLAAPMAVAKIGSAVCCSLGGGFNVTADAVKIDVSDPTAPSLAAALDYEAVTLYACNFVIEHGAYWFMGGQRGSGGNGFIASIKASDFTAGSRVASGNNGEGANFIAKNAAGTRAYACPGGGSHDLWTADISDPTSLVSKSRIDLGLAVPSVAPIVVSEDLSRLYVGSTVNIKIVDNVTDLDTPSVEGTISTGGNSVVDMCRITDGCAGFAWSAFAGGTVHLLGTPATS